MGTCPLWRTGLLLAALLGTGGTLQGWSEKGHRVVARAAQEHLSANAQRRLSFLLGKEATLADVAGWADDLVLSRPETEAWHSITIPPDAEAVDLKRDCPLGDCITARVRDSIGIVRLAIRPREEIVEAFKLLVGLSADMHHPLLSGYPPGQSKDHHVVVFDGQEMTLFDAWDRGLLDRMGSEDELLRRVLGHITASDTDAWREGTLNAWTWDTHRVAVDHVYPSVSGAERTVLEGAALRRSTDLIVEQLAKASVRLTQMLDDVWP